MRDKGFDQLPVLAPTSKKLVGLVTLGNLLSWIGRGRATGESPVRDVMFDFSKIPEVVTDFRSLTLIAPSKGKKHHLSNGTSGKEDMDLRKQRRFVEFTMDTHLKTLSRFFEWDSAAIVTEKDEAGNMKPVAVVTKVDLLTWFVKQGKIEI